MNYARPLILLLALSFGAFAQSGKKLYEQYCGACHSNDGHGAQQGQFPPLADSAWVKGKPDRMLQVVLYGLMGEIEVPSKHAASATYDLVMPPQGDALTNEQIAVITTYIRSAWGNKETAVTSEMVEEQRRVSVGRKEIWEASSLLKEYPLRSGGAVEKKIKPETRIKDLISYVYPKVKWSTLPYNWKNIKPEAVEEEHGGLISTGQAELEGDFGMVWEGKITTPGRGSYTFKLDADDGARLLIRGRRVAQIIKRGELGRVVQGTMILGQGEHPVRIEYFNRGKSHGITLGMIGPGTNGWIPLSESGAGAGGAEKKVKIPLYPLPGQAVIYRNFIEGTTPRAIGVGYHGGVNLAFSADYMSLDLIWTGSFIDASRHWTGRGKGNQPPAGQHLVKVSRGPSFAILPKHTSPWPHNYFQEEIQARFRGYRLNKKGEPTFLYSMGSLQVADFPQPVVGGNRFGLRRQFTVSATKPPTSLYFRASKGVPVKRLGEQEFELDGKVVLKIEGSAAGKASVRNGNELMLPVLLKRGLNTFELSYSWK